MKYFLSCCIVGLVFFNLSFAQRDLLDSKVRDLLTQEFSGSLAKEHVIQLTRHNRIQGSRQFRTAAQYVLSQLRSFGVNEKDAYIESFTSDGKTAYQTWQSPSGWDIESAELRMVEPFEESIVRLSLIHIYHELLHQLMNFKLRSLPLYTHPFLQEGFAVAFGGRGGIAPQTIFQSGVFLNKSRFADYHELFAASEFLLQDASMTYPLSGLYVRFVFEQFGVQRFLKLYRTYSGSGDAMKKMILKAGELPSAQAWEKFIDSVANNPTIQFVGGSTSRISLLRNEDVAISFAGDFYAIEMKNNFGLKPLTSSSAYASVKFNEVLPRERYGGERYLITADSNEIVVYDLYTNNSIAGYAAGFSLPPKSVPIENGAYTFVLRKDVLPVVPNNYEIVSYAK